MTTPGRLPVADELWLAAHDNLPRRSVVRPETLALGLAGALLAELAGLSRIAIEPQTADEGARVRLRAPGDCGHLGAEQGCATCARVQWRLDPAQHAVFAGLGARLEHVRRSGVDRNRVPSQDLSTWLRHLQEPADRQYLGGPVTTLVEHRLAAGGLVEQVERGLVRKRLGWQPRDMVLTGSAVKTISQRFRAGAGLTPEDLLLAGLVFAIGLDARAFDLLRGGQRDELRRRALLGLPPPVQALLLTTQNLHHKTILIR
ncbi:GPP34 family phosphoprotein [Symbioplanes lichenis]|uniref:GPP34 family phosphoprotein n=1 Tax=Symbioplanes lichenis TaxID=1629072 RepID=UPI0027394ED0|nr:GPP34 family phosphoprotein [Actinoplanes lichenis]